MFLNVSKYLRKLESNNGSPLKGLRGAAVLGFLQRTVEARECGTELLRSRA